MDIPEFKLEEAAERLIEGGIVVFPTETFYGIGCRIDAVRACQKIAALKGERALKPFPVICADMKSLLEWYKFPDEESLQTLKILWPAPLSVLLEIRPEKKEFIAPLACREGFSAVRIPDYAPARRLCALAQAPLTATSANISGAPPAVEFFDINPRVRSAADCSIEGGRTKGEQPSTIIEFIDPKRIRIIRNGVFSLKTLEKYYSIIE